MGADLIFSINELKVTRDQALTNAAIVARGELKTILADLEDMAGVTRFTDIDTDNMTSDDRTHVEEYLIECVQTVYDFGRRRDCSFFTVDKDRIFAITAGMSWGDEPTEAYEAFNVCEILGLTEKVWGTPVLSSGDAQDKT